jgi:hypothetical protein
VVKDKGAVMKRKEREDRLRRLEALFGISHAPSLLTPGEQTRLAWIFSRGPHEPYRDPPKGWKPSADRGPARPVRPTLPMFPSQARAKLAEIYAAGKDIRKEMQAQFM